MIIRDVFVLRSFAVSVGIANLAELYTSEIVWDSVLYMPIAYLRPGQIRFALQADNSTFMCCRRDCQTQSQLTISSCFETQSVSTLEPVGIQRDKGRYGDGRLSNKY